MRPARHACPPRRAVYIIRYIARGDIDDAMRRFVSYYKPYAVHRVYEYLCMVCMRTCAFAVVHRGVNTGRTKRRAFALPYGTDGARKNEYRFNLFLFLTTPNTRK